LRSARRLFLLCFGLASCAVGVDSGSDPTGTSDAGARSDATPQDGSAGDTGSTPDTGSLPDAGASDTGTGSDTGLAETGTGADTGTIADAVANDVVTVSDSGCVGSGTTGALVTFDLSAESGSEASAAPKTSATGVTGGALSRAAGLTAVSGSGSINASGWPTTATASAADYYTFTVTPAAGCAVTLSTLAVDASASGTGPSKGDVATSGDAFAAHTTSFAGTSKTTVTLASPSGTGPIEVRVYGYGASGSTGTFRIQNTLTLSGSIH
jgi:hypothetical protein